MRERVVSGFVGLAAVAAILIMFLLGKACAREMRTQELVGGYIADTAVTRLAENVAIFARHNSTDREEFRIYHKEILLQKINAVANLIPAIKDLNVKQEICEQIRATQQSLKDQDQRHHIDEVVAGRLREIGKTC